MNSKSSPAASQFASPLSTIIASPSPDKHNGGDDVMDAAQVKVIIVIIFSFFSVLQFQREKLVVSYSGHCLHSTVKRAKYFTVTSLKDFLSAHVIFDFILSKILDFITVYDFIHPFFLFIILIACRVPVT